MEAAAALLRRVVGEKATAFVLEHIPSADGLNCYEIDAGQGKIILRGDTGVSLAHALYQYLKTYCGVHISWCGSRIELPDELPIPTQKIRQVIPQKYRAIYNYCTFGYSMPFWDWERWEQEIDFLALNGINMPLAPIGTEAVWYEVLQKVGFTGEEALQFLSGPAYYPWQCMTNFEGVLPPKDASYVYRRLELGKKIIEREVQLGMFPVQQGFSGFVPRAFIRKFPKAHITLTRRWAKFPKTAQLDPTDPLFQTFGSLFLQTQKALLGDYGFYAADPFHESKPTVRGEAYLNAVGQAIFTLLHNFNPQSVWVMQSWSLREPIMKAVPKEHLLIWDLDGRIRLRHDNFSGYPFLLGRLDNFGQKTYFHGNISRTAENEFGKLCKELPNLAGTGLFMEGSLSNPLYYEALFDVQTSSEPIDVEPWLRSYCRRRYGAETENAVAANRILFQHVYVEPLYDSGYSSVLCALPMFCVQSSGQCDFIQKPYEPAYIRIALEKLLADRDRFYNVYTYQYDVADLTRQFVSNTAIVLHDRFVRAYRARDRKAYLLLKKAFLDLFVRLDEVLRSFPEMNFYKWLDDAKKLAENEAESRWLEENASALLTIWGPYKNSEIYDYAWREWAGLLRDFYLPRWEMFFERIEKKNGRRTLYLERLLPRKAGKIYMRATPFYAKLVDWTVAWCRRRKHDTAAAPQDPVALCAQILLDYTQFSV